MNKKVHITEPLSASEIRDAIGVTHLELENVRRILDNMIPRNDQFSKDRLQVKAQEESEQFHMPRTSE